MGRPVLSDFGSAMDGSQVQICDVQPDVYRSPEMMLKAEWSYPIDIWNVGVMVSDLKSNAAECRRTNEKLTDLGLIRRKTHVSRPGS